jgi:hypothetical protein
MDDKVIDKSFNEKRKWQIALRRYIINKNKSVNYAPFFGISIDGFRNWIETQFNENIGWDNFSTDWHFEHVLPLAYFNFDNEEELKMCWHFTNIKVEKMQQQKALKPDLTAIKQYFTAIVNNTDLTICKAIINKIEQIPNRSVELGSKQLLFLQGNQQDLQTLATFSAYEFERLNTGDSIKTLLAEKALMEKFG